MTIKCSLGISCVTANKYTRRQTVKVKIRTPIQRSHWDSVSSCMYALADVMEWLILPLYYGTKLATGE